jgi:hypothetical protein
MRPILRLIQSRTFTTFTEPEANLKAVPRLLVLVARNPDMVTISIPTALYHELLAHRLTPDEPVWKVMERMLRFYDARQAKIIRSYVIRAGP